MPISERAAVSFGIYYEMAQLSNNFLIKRYNVALFAMLGRNGEMKNVDVGIVASSDERLPAAIASDDVCHVLRRELNDLL